MKKFLGDKIPSKPGLIVTVEGEKVGEHEGIAPFTIGQRHGLGIGGGTPYFVVDKQPDTNTLVVSKGADHPALYKGSLEAGEWVWVSGSEPELPMRCTARIRYRQPLQKCELVPSYKSGIIKVKFDQEQRAISPGQFVVVYSGDEVLGGGVIIK